MSEDDKYTVTDLISTALEAKPVEFEQRFDSLILDRLRDAVETRKQEIAATMFKHSQVETPEEE